MNKEILSIIINYVFIRILEKVVDTYDIGSK